MSDLLRDNNDFHIVNGDFQVIEDATAVEQRIIERLRSFAREWFLDEEGLPYLTDIFGRQVNLRTAYSLFLDTIATTRGVSRVTEFDVLVNTDTRSFMVTAAIETVQGGSVSIREDRVGEIEEDREGILDLSANFIQDLSGNNIDDLTLGV